MLKKLVEHGDGKAIVIDKSVLKEAGIDDNSVFQITVIPTGIVIKNVELASKKKLSFHDVAKRVVERNRTLMERLANR